MDIEFNRRERITGFFLLLVVLLLLTSVIFLGRGKDWFKSYVRYYIVFDEAYNLEEQAAVKIAKANIGKIRKIDLSGDKVRMDIVILEEHSSRIRQGSVATVSSPAFIGSYYLSIRPGPSDSPLIEPGGRIESEARKSLDDILQEFKIEQTAKNVVQAVNQITEIVERLHDMDGPLFATLNRTSQTMDHVEAIIGDMQAGQGTIGEILKSKQLIVQLYAVLQNLDVILANIAKTTISVPSTVDEINLGLARINEVVEAVSQLSSTIGQILDNLEKASHDVPKVTESTKLGINEMRDSMRGVDRVVESISRNPLIRGNLPPEPQAKEADANLRP